MAAAQRHTIDVDMFRNTDTALEELQHKLSSLHSAVGSISESLVRSVNSSQANHRLGEERFQRLTARVDALFQSRARSHESAESTKPSPMLQKIDSSSGDLVGVYQQQAVLHTAIDELTAKITGLEVSHTLNDFQQAFVQKIEAMLHKHLDEALVVALRKVLTSMPSETNSSNPSNIFNLFGSAMEQACEPDSEEEHTVIKPKLESGNAAEPATTQSNESTLRPAHVPPIGDVMHDVLGTKETSHKRFCQKHVKHLDRVLKSRIYISITCFLILVQSACMGWEVNENMQLQKIRFLNEQDTKLALPDHFETIRHIFAGIWAIEVLLRLIAQQLSFFSGMNWSWNCFDLALVVMSIVELFFDLDADVSFLRGIRIMRVARVLRIFRVFAELRKMIFALMHCMMSLLWLSNLLFIVIYMFALAFMQGAAHYLESLLPSQTARVDEYGYPSNSQKVLLVFDNILVAMRFLFANITGGTAWNESMEPLIEYFWLWEALAIFYVVFFIFGVMNVVTGVFVDQAMMIANSDRETRAAELEQQAKKSESEIRNLVKAADQDGNGTITREELHKLLDNDWVQKWLRTIDLVLDPSHVKEIINALDPYDMNCITYDEFFDIVSRLQGPARNSDLTILLYEFRTSHAELRKLHDLQNKKMRQLHRAASVPMTLDHSNEPALLPTPQD